MVKKSLRVRCHLWPRCNLLVTNTLVEDSSSVKTLCSPRHTAKKTTRRQHHYNRLFKKNEIKILAIFADFICSRQPSPLEIVVLGTNDLGNVDETMMYEIQTKYKHESYNNETFVNDIMLLKVKSKGECFFLPLKRFL